MGLKKDKKDKKKKSKDDEIESFSLDDHRKLYSESIINNSGAEKKDISKNPKKFLIDSYEIQDNISESEISEAYKIDLEHLRPLLEKVGNNLEAFAYESGNLVLVDQEVKENVKLLDKLFKEYKKKQKSKSKKGSN